MRRRAVLAAGGALALGRGARAEDAGSVDLLLVLAVDVSRSIDEEEARLQREGYQAAMMDPQVVAAITGGPSGAIAVAYLEWAGIQYQRVVIPWVRLGSAAECAAWSARLRFAIAEHWPAAQQAAPGLKRWSVRVQPAAASTGARA